MDIKLFHDRTEFLEIPAENISSVDFQDGFIFLNGQKTDFKKILMTSNENKEWLPVKFSENFANGLFKSWPGILFNAGEQNISFKISNLEEIVCIPKKASNKAGCKVIVADILSLFEKISLPYIKNLVSLKKDAIVQQLLSFDLNRKITVDAKVGIIVESATKQTHCLMSHMDLIPLFSKEFFNLKGLEVNQEHIEGPLDNTITNSILLYLLKNNLVPSGYSVCFSNDEESSGWAAYIYASSCEPDVSFINLDVTNEGFSEGVSFEYDRPGPVAFEKISKASKKFNWFVTNDRFFDDTSNILRANRNALSLCLSTRGTIHSMNNQTLTSHIEKYIDAILWVFSSKLTLDNPDVNKGTKKRDIW